MLCCIPPRGICNVLRSQSLEFTPDGIILGTLKIKKCVQPPFDVQGVTGLGFVFRHTTHVQLLLVSNCKPAWK